MFVGTVPCPGVHGRCGIVEVLLSVNLKTTGIREYWYGRKFCRFVLTCVYTVHTYVRVFLITRVCTRIRVVREDVLKCA